MKLLFVAPLLDFSGFAVASRRFLRALQSNPEIEVVARALKYDQLDTGQKFSTPDYIKQSLEKSIQSGVEMCLQMTTSNVEAVPVHGVINALYTFLESDRLQLSWVQKANQFDFLIVPCRANAEAMVRSGVHKPILVCAVPCDKEDYEKQYEPFKIVQSEGRTVFYNICQLSWKKGIDSLLRAYYAAFYNCPDEVLLVLKTYINMQDRSNDLEQVKNFVNSIKQRTRIPIQKWPPVLPLVFTISEADIMGLHTAGHCYVNSSRAEGWNIPLFDAMALGRTAISNVAGGMADYVTTDNCLVYSGTPNFFMDMPHPDPGLYTGLEQCFEPCVPEMALLMRKYHLLRKASESKMLNEENSIEWMAIKDRCQNASLLRSKFDYRAVGLKLTHQLLTVLENWKLTKTIAFDHEAAKENSKI